MSCACGSRVFPRERCAAALASFIARVAAQPVHRIPYDKRFDVGRPWSTRVFGTVCARVRSVWVFGSFARGAIECRDVDLIVDVELSWLGNAHWGQFRDDPPKRFKGSGNLNRRFSDLMPKVFGALRAPLSRASTRVGRDPGKNLQNVS